MSSYTTNWNQIGPQSNPQSRSAPALPVELLLIIFDTVIENSFESEGICDYETFPQIIQQLRTPWERRRELHPWIHNLRLVCRTFSAILPSPKCFMDKNTTVLPTTTKVVYVNASANVHVCLQRLVAEPFRSHHIFQLDIMACDYSQRDKSILQPFDVLCTLADFLPSIRSLTLGFRNNTSRIATPRFWERLNDAFPYLLCLVFRNWVISTYESPAVEFKHLRILDVDHVQLDKRLLFPALRHVAFGNMSAPDTMKFTAWSRLESLVLRAISPSLIGISWDWFPRLKLLAIPGRRGTVFYGLPHKHPLRHLHLYIAANADYGSPSTCWYPFDWVKEMVRIFHTVDRLSLSPLLGNEGIASKTDGFTEGNANSIRFTLAPSIGPRARQVYLLFERKPSPSRTFYVAPPRIKVPDYMDSVASSPTPGPGNTNLLAPSTMRAPEYVNPFTPSTMSAPEHTNPIAIPAPETPKLVVPPTVQALEYNNPFTPASMWVSEYTNPVVPSTVSVPENPKPTVPSTTVAPENVTTVVESASPAPNYTSQAPIPTLHAPAHTFPPVQPEPRPHRSIWDRIRRIFLCGAHPADHPAEA